MTMPSMDEIQRTMAGLAQQRAKLLEARRELEKGSVSASSKDHLLTVTVSMSGEVKEIKFDRTDYATMAPLELSALLVSTINAAREKSIAKAQEAFSSLAGFGTTMRDALAGSDELDKLFSAIAEESSESVERSAPEDDLDG